MRILAILSFGLWGFASGALACEVQWLARNMIFNLQGYCFGSNLGQALFDNSDCTTSQPSLSARDQGIVAQIREDEEWIGCQVDTSATRLRMPNLDAWLRLELVPLPDTLASGCMGYKGGPIALRAGPWATAPVTGYLMPGEDIIFEFFGEAGWSFFNSAGGNGAGWTQSRIPDEMCTSFAG